MSMFQEQNRFQARSGRTIKVGEDGSLIFDHVNGYLGTDSVFDAEEYFQAKRDAELGRWRWPENPHYVVYADGDRAVVVDERNGDRTHYLRTLCEGSPAEVSADGLHAAVHAYFEAHPDGTPDWADAEVIVWDDGAYLPQIAQRDLVGDKGWWWGDEPGGGQWRSAEDLAKIVGGATVQTFSRAVVHA